MESGPADQIGRTGHADQHGIPKDQRQRRRFDQYFATFEVEGNVYREMRAGFEKWSNTAFPDMFGIPGGQTPGGRVGSDENPIRLLECTAAEFENLLEVMYATEESTPEINRDEWLGVLKLSRLWNMPQLAAMTVHKISPELSPFEKITMGKANAHRVAQWIREGYTAIIGDLSEATLEGLAADLGWEVTARVLWALKKACFKSQPSLANLSTSDVVEEIVNEELGEDDSEFAVKADLGSQRPFANLSAGDVVEEIVEGELGGKQLAEFAADLGSMYREAVPSPLRHTVTQDESVAQRSGLEEIIRGDDSEIEAGLRLMILEAVPSLLRITVTQEQPVPRRAGIASLISFAPDGVYVSRDHAKAPTRVLQDFGYDTGGWRVDKHVRVVGDTTGSGLSDIIAFGNAGVYVSRNNGDGSFASAKLVLKEFSYNSGWRVDKHLRYVLDLRKNGFVDIIGFGDGGVYVALNKGNGTFNPPKIVLPDFGYHVGGWRLDRHLRVLADVTGNGLPDIIGFGEEAVYVALNNGDGTFQRSKVAIQNFTPGAGGWLVEKHPRTIADVTGDGLVDIIGFFDDGVHIALNAGDGTFYPSNLVVYGFGYCRAAWRVENPRFVADITGNGCCDIIGYSGIYFSAALNNADGTFKPPGTLFNDPRGRYETLFLDLTGNGAADTIAFDTDAIRVTYNDGKGGFGPVQKLREFSSGGVDKTVHWVTNLYA